MKKGVFGLVLGNWIIGRLRTQTYIKFYEIFYLFSLVQGTFGTLINALIPPRLGTPLGLEMFFP